MHPIDYYVYRIYLYCERSLFGDTYYKIHNAMAGIAFMLLIPVLFILMPVVIEYSSEFVVVSFFVLAIVLPLTAMYISRKYYTSKKIKELCARYKDHEMNKHSYFFVSMLVVLAGVLLEFFGAFAMFLVIRYNR